MELSDLVHGLKPKSGSKKSSEKSSSSSPDRPGRSGASSATRVVSTSKSKSRAKTQGDKSDSSSSSPPPEIPSASRVGSSGSGSHKLMCDICQRTFDTQTQFDQHVTVFHKRSKGSSKPREASFLCPFCGKAFTSPSKRNVHQNATHMGLRPHRCTICDKSFGYKGDLTKHMSTHSGVKAHTCYICGAKFSRNFYVKRHIETVHEKKNKKK